MGTQESLFAGNDKNIIKVQEDLRALRALGLGIIKLKRIKDLDRGLNVGGKHRVKVSSARLILFTEWAPPLLKGNDPQNQIQ
jgi:hypothetical protein